MNARIFTSLISMVIGILLTAGVLAQSPEKMSYQAVIRNSSNQLVTGQEVGIQISILQGSASGTAVYVETQAPTTNANGLVSIEIGTGTTSDDFSTIDWASGTYYIKTETDPEGGTSYTITGTSQLLSVPYALHAKTAETLTGTITETDPAYTASQAANITAVDIVNLSNLSGTNTGDQDISGIGVNSQAIQDTALQIRSDIPDVSGFISTETDPAFTSWDKSTGISITESQISDFKIYLTTEVDGSTTNEIEMPTDATAGDMSYSDGAIWKKVPAPSEDNMVLTYCKGVPVWTSNGECPVAVGDYAFGGVVFYIFQESDSGYVEGEQHGLVCTISDQSTDTEWGCNSSMIPGADGTAVGTGAQNTIDIEAACPTIGIPADICANLSLNGYDDWFLPSKDELNLMYQNKAIIDITAIANGGSPFGYDYYWSSSEYNSNSAWELDFRVGIQNRKAKLIPFRVRAARAF